MPRIRVKRYYAVGPLEDATARGLAMDTNKNVQKETFRGYTTLNFPSFTDHYILCKHNLGYAPAFKVFYDNNDGVYHSASSAVADFAGPAYDVLRVYSDAINLYVDGFTGIYNLKYFIFENKS